MGQPEPGAQGFVKGNLKLLLMGGFYLFVHEHIGGGASNPFFEGMEFVFEREG